MSDEIFHDDLPLSTRQLRNTASSVHNASLGAGNAPYEEALVSPVSEDIFLNIAGVAEEVGGEYEEPELYQGSVARTMFDTPQSKDNTLTLVLSSAHIRDLPTQSLVRIRSTDARSYLGVVVEGPFAEPDGLRGDSPIVVTVTVAGSVFMPKYHGRVQVAILGEETPDGLIPPRFRPLPNSPAVPLDAAETAQTLQIAPDDSPLRLGLAVGHEDLPIAIPAHHKGVLPRHLAVLGTTGGGKTTTVSGMIGRFQQASLAVTLIDIEGEYTWMNEPTTDQKMQRILAQRGMDPACVNNTVLYHLVGKETSNRRHPVRREFCLRFANLSPYLVVEILEMSEAQEHRYLVAYDIAKRVLADLGIFPQKGNDDQETQLMELDEMESGYPSMRLEHMYDIVRACGQIINKQRDSVQFYAPEFRSQRDRILGILDQNTDLPKSYPSWLALQGRLKRLQRLKIFDVAGSGGKVNSLNFAEFTTPGQVSIIDLSGTDAPQVNNLVIAELLRGIHDQQDENFKRYEQKQAPLTRALVIVEEAHEFLSRERIKQMPVLFQQVARIARRGRKRWLGLAFVTQLPQHLPDEVLGLVNNFILHKISDSGVVDRLKKTIGGIDESLWMRLPNLAPGQAIVSMTSMTRPLLAAVDPTPCKLRMTEEEEGRGKPAGG